MTKTTTKIVSAISAAAILSTLTSAMMFQASAAEANTPEKTKTVQIGVIDYLAKETNEKDYQVHVWNDAGYENDVKCKNTGIVATYCLGDEHWENTPQHFYMYTAEVPENADCYKFHIGDRYFGGDGCVEASTKAFVFNYDGDKAHYVYNTSAKVVRIGIIDYIDNENDSKNYKVHCWNNAGFSTDVKCVNDGTVTTKSLGKEFWNDKAQTFHMYTAVLPANADSFKFHIGDRYFGDDATYSSSRIAFVFNYDGDHADYYRF